MSGSERLPSVREERANALVHVVGFLLALAAAASLLRPPMAGVPPAVLGGMAVFCAAAALTMASSATYHALRQGRPARRWFLALDHAAIGLLIAGTYTPFTLLVLQGGARLGLLLPLWAVALGSAAMQLVSVGTRRPPWIERHSYVLYLGMGWVPGLVVGRQVLAMLPPDSLVLLVAGGLAYTGGVLLYLARRIPYHHAMWHAAVVLGALLQFLAIRDAALRL